MSKRTEKTLLVSLLTLFVLLSATYSVIVPPFEASDELWHYPMVKYVADHRALPVQDPANVGPWRQEGSQPPLYYVLGASATFWIDTSDMAQVRHLNPHVDSGIATPDGNVNLVVHRAGREAFPWRGTVLAIHVLRLLSVLMSTAGVLLTYFVVREVLPQQPTVALGATALHAFTPMVVFIAGTVNNDNLVVPLSSLALLMLLRLLRRQGGTLRQSVGRYLLLGVVLGLAALTKASSLALTLLTALVVTVRAVRRRSAGPRDPTAVEGWKEFVVGALATLLPLLAIAGWWYLRNLRLYGDPTGLNAFIEILGKRDVPADLAQLWRERYSFMAGYWGNFGGLNVPMDAWVYRILNIGVVLAGVGLVVALVKSQIRKPKAQRVQADAEGVGLRIWGVGFVVCILWGLGVLIPWIQWARVTWSSQGRLVFAALPVWSMLLALGWAGWLPHRWRRWALGAPVLFLMGLSIAAPFVWIRHAYALPNPLTGAQVQAIPHRLNVDFDSAMRLLGYHVESQATRPGGQVAATLYWEAIVPTEEDYTVFVHLLGEHDLLVAQRDTFPALGLLSTTWLEPGFRWADRYVLQLPATAYAPDKAQIEVGLFTAGTGERLPAVESNGEPSGDNVHFGHVEIQAQTGAVPNPISVNFGDRLRLTGYDLSQRAARPGETITLTLHWEGLRSMEHNYTVSAQLVDPAQRKAAQHDSWPLDGNAPTTTWKRGQTVVDAIPLTIFPDAPGTAYSVRIAVYLHQEGEIVHVPVTPPGGRMQANSITLTQVRVAP
ncbi:MAG: glycosyltransferase family 39 protein [Anaerolineae bacterium]|jgi:4-amino-4-deoxy-L-arabinose transferase-like glycosyltransferase